MRFSNSIKHKLFFILIIMGALPFIIVIIMSTMNMIADWEKSVERNGLLRNAIISEHVTELFEKNFYVLHALAVNNLIIDYVKNPQPDNYQRVKFLMHDTNKIFGDKNTLALTDINGEQLIRTDDFKLVNIINRQHFKAAMQRRDFVSDVILAMSTGNLTVVLAAPILDEKNNVVGLLQRNFNLQAFQDFAETQDDAETFVMILDRSGRIIADSEHGQDLVQNFNSDTYRFIYNNVSSDSGTIRTYINGEDSLISYSQNDLTDWTIVTVQPYKYIFRQVYSEIFKYALAGLIMLLIVSVVAYWTSIHATRPIIEIVKTANKIASGSTNIESLKITSKDEFGSMAEAFNKMRTARDNYQLEARIDKLTKLFNKSTFENVCHLKLQEYVDAQDNENLMALYIVDLDHFKEVNDTKGHQFGDKVLEEFSKHLRKCFRPYDCVARFGGDEFVVIIEHMPNIDVIIRKAEAINKVARELEISGENAKVSASIGIAIVPNNGTDYEEIFKAADEALYYVKKNGRDGYHCA